MSRFSLSQDLSLKVGIREGRFSFEVLVKQLREVGYITENSKLDKCALISTTMEMLRQEDFDELFSFFYPGILNDIRISCIATDKGGEDGAFSYAIYNKNEISQNQILEILKKENSKIYADLSST